MILNIFSGGDPVEAVDAGEALPRDRARAGRREQIAFTLNDLWRPYAAVSDLRGLAGLSRGGEAVVA